MKDYNAGTVIFPPGLSYYRIFIRDKNSVISLIYGTNQLKFVPQINQICPELEIYNILFIVDTRLLPRFPFLRAKHKRLRIRSKDIKQSIHSNAAITKRYLGLRQEEILQAYDCLSF